jgi:hypothetical protein
MHEFIETWAKVDMMIYYVFNLSTVSIGGQFESRSACDSKDKTAFNRVENLVEEH